MDKEYTRGLCRSFREYFEGVRVEYSREDFASGTALAERWLALIDRQDSDSVGAIEAGLDLFCDLNRLWCEVHFGASGWQQFRMYLLLWLCDELFDHQVALTPGHFERLARAFAVHFTKLSGELGELGVELCTSWLELIGSGSGGPALALAARAEQGQLARVGWGHGLEVLIRLWERGLAGS